MFSVAVVGSPGVGKSRLLQDLFDVPAKPGEPTRQPTSHVVGDVIYTEMPALDDIHGIHGAEKWSLGNFDRAIAVRSCQALRLRDDNYSAARDKDVTVILTHYDMLQRALRAEHPNASANDIKTLALNYIKKIMGVDQPMYVVCDECETSGNIHFITTPALREHLQNQCKL